MNSTVKIDIDSRNADEIVVALLARRFGYVPQWLPAEKGSDAAILQIAARYLQSILQRLNQAPEKNKLAFLDLLGIELIPAQAARVPIVIQLSAQAPNNRIPAGTRLAAPPPPDSTEQIVFETERSAGLAAAQLKEVFSLWAGRDQYIDHSPAYLAGQALQPFNKRQLQDTPHILYIAHDTLLALKGKARVDVRFELTQPSSEPLDTLWTYWDGQVWRGFQDLQLSDRDGTQGFTRSGKLQLESDCAEAVKTTVNGIEAFWIRGQLTEPLPLDPSKILPEVDGIKLFTEIERSLAIDILSDQETVEVKGGFTPDRAFADTVALDLTSSFYPFGQQPQPGATFYFSSEEAFSKPGATLQIYLQRTETPQDQLAVPVSPPVPIIEVASESEEVSTVVPSAIAIAPSVTLTQALEPTLSWEYWNGDRWVALSVQVSNPSAQEGDLNLHHAMNLSSTGDRRDRGGRAIFSLTVPTDMAKTTVNDQDGLWMRLRLVSGGFGFKQSIPLAGTDETFTFVVLQPPALSDFRLGYTWQYGPFYPEHVLTYNDFQYADRTYEAKWSGVTFQPFQFVSDVTPTFYLGFDQKLPVDRFNLYFDIVEQRGETQGPSLQWDYWNGVNWHRLSVEDETRYLRIPGMVSLIPAEDSDLLARFGTPRHWLRARLQEDGPPGSPTINGIFSNAVWAAQQQTITNDPLGASNGQPHQVFNFRQIPVLAGEQIEVRELTGLRANVEWRIVAMELFNGNTRILRMLEEQLAAEGTQTDVEMPPLRLRRDRNKRVTEVWVRWQYQKHLFNSGSNDRHYLLERTRGRLMFGDGERGQVPPPGAAILVRQYRSGGGLKGNVAARTITQVLAAIGGAEAVFNPKPAEGGAEAETLAALITRGPQTLRHRGRGITPQDYETLAKEASPAVAVARAIPTRDPSGRRRPGWVTLAIVPQTAEPRPYPSFGLREQVRQFIETRVAADVAAAQQIYITGPQYQAIDVEATIVPVDPAEAGAVEQRAREALANFLHPLRGSPDRLGWQPGRDVFLSDVAAVLERVEGVDYVKNLALLLNGALQGERVKVAEDWTVVAGKIRLKMQLGERFEVP